MGLDYVPEKFKINRELSNNNDKAIYLLETEGNSFCILKKFDKTYKYPLYERLSYLSHKNLPKIHEPVLLEDSFYILEDYIEGVALREKLNREGALDEKAAVNIILQLCDVLSYLHEQSPSIIHRDIKPENIILTNDNIVKLLDFDIAREHNEIAAKDTEIIGTKHYAPPEQYGFGQSDHRTDIYSVGVLMTMLLTNTYKKEKINCPDLRNIVAKCTSFEPKNRYSSVRKLRNALIVYERGGFLKLLRTIFYSDDNIYIFPHTKISFLKSFLITFVSFAAFSIAANQFPFVEGPIGIIEMTIRFSFFAFFVFIVYDYFKLLCYQRIQKRYMKDNQLLKPLHIPFVIATKKYVFLTITAVLAALEIYSIDLYADYVVDNYTIIFIVSCAAILSLIIRGGGYPRYYNKAVRYYYKGDMSQAVRYAQKSVKSKKNFAKMWLADILEDCGNIKDI